VPGSKRKRPPGGFYDERAIGLRVDQARVNARLEVKQLCDLMGWHKSEYTRKITKPATPLWPGEASKLKVIFRKPTGWPYIDETLGLIIDAQIKTKGDER
jgi:hypothetical protein